MHTNEVHVPDRRRLVRRLIEEGRYCEARSELLIYCHELHARLNQAGGKTQTESLQSEWDEFLAEARTYVLAGRAHVAIRSQELRKLQRFLNVTQSGRTWSLLG